MLGAWRVNHPWKQGCSGPWRGPLSSLIPRRYGWLDGPGRIAPGSPAPVVSGGARVLRPAPFGAVTFLAVG